MNCSPSFAKFLGKQRRMRTCPWTAICCLLKRKSPEAVPFLLAALRRFDGIGEDAIKRLTLEVAVLGQEGIDYADAAKRHRLKAAPDEEFSGLEIMCLLYAGLKRLAPAEADPGFDLNDEFAMALELYHSEKQQ